jgi:muramoyltetrapeptide carboxypeptidase
VTVACVEYITRVNVTPPPLRAGDKVAIVAPSSPFPRQEFLTGLAWLAARYRIVASDKMSSRQGYLAGSDARRRDELSQAMLAEDVKAIVVARGGYGATRFVADLPWETFARKPKWIVGFSDVTALHVATTAHGVRSVHGPNVTGLGRANPWTRHRFLRALEQPEESFEWKGLLPLREGEATGIAVGGNLALVEAMAAARMLVLPKKAVLLLEDVTERPYRIDRMLTALRVGGYFSDLAAVVFGSFSECPTGPDGVTVEQVLSQLAEELEVPVVCGAPFGHTERNDSFVLGRTVQLRGDTLTFV